MPRLTLVDKLLITSALAYGVSHLMGPARAHLWYPPECCSDQDCARVEKIEQVPEGMKVTTKHGTVLVPTDYKARPSQDSDFHACISNYPDEGGGSGGPYLICFFEPSGS